ncbi:MAG TPA: hypothetical protein DF613_08290 [Lachnospiraceae bacterium]|nr:hypothetical protein [Lachnospiraceae bacterium]
MSSELSLREGVAHGTPKRPLRAMHFAAGPGTTYPEHFFKERHWHRYGEILLILKGDYQVEINLETKDLHPGDICLINSGELHQLTGIQPTALHDAVLFDPQILNFSYRDEWEDIYIAPVLEQSQMMQNILHPGENGYTDIHALVTELTRVALLGENGWYIRCKILLLELFEKLGRNGLFVPMADTVSKNDARKIARYKAIVSYIEEHCQEPVTLHQLADTVSCNTQYLCRFFREIAGMSPIQYLITYRLERACHMLAHTTLPVTAIALDCGFDNISYFIRKFKDIKGCTPKEYRQKSK